MHLKNARQGKIKYENSDRRKKRHGLQISDRMKLRHTILKGERREQTMSEKIVQLNEEVIKGQNKELVRGRVEEILDEFAGGGSRKTDSSGALRVQRGPSGLL